MDSFIFCSTSTWSPPHARYRNEKYRNQPLSITDYEPGFSSIAFKEARVVSIHFFFYRTMDGLNVFKVVIMGGGEGGGGINLKVLFAIQFHKISTKFFLG